VWGETRCNVTNTALVLQLWLMGSPRRDARMPPKWLPDWTDPAGYPVPAAPLHDWAWQFLRRNPEYQTDWDHAVTRHIRRDDGIDPIAWHHMRQLGRKYGVLLPVDPAANEGRPHFDAMCITIPRSSAAPPLHRANVQFDLRVPLELQWPLVKSHLENLRASRRIEVISTPRHHREKWRNYLRILDARCAGASHSEIAAVLFPELPNEYDDDYIGSRQVKNQRRAAERLRDGGYRGIFPAG